MGLLSPQARVASHLEVRLVLDALVWGAALGVGASLHCAGMCGVIGCALLFTSGSPEVRRPAWQRLATMQVGRVFSYALLGLIFGIFGAGAYRMLEFGGAHMVMQWAAATIVVWMGLATAGLMPSIAGVDRAFAPLASRLAQMRMALSQSGPELDLVAGMIWGLTPCPLVYLAILNAMLLGTIEQSVLMMLVFGAVTSIPVTISALTQHRAANRSTFAGRRLAGGVLVGAGVTAFLLSAPGSPFCIT